MAKRSSRHTDAQTYRYEAAGRSVNLCVPRVVPLKLVLTRHRVTAHDRLDSISERYYSDPLQYWRIADANPSNAPEELLEAGSQLDIPEAD
jgi:nucleoid-associated protein YgaU